MKIFNKVIIIMLIGIMALFSAGCQKLDLPNNRDAKEPMQGAPIENTIIVKGKDVKSGIVAQLAIPSDWIKQSDMNQLALIEYSNLEGDKHVLVSVEPLERFTENISLNEYRKIILDDIMPKIDHAKLKNIRTVTIDNKDAMMFEIHGEVDETKTSYLYGLVKGNNGFFQIAALTSTNDFEQNKDGLMDIIKSFKEGPRESTAKENIPSKNRKTVKNPDGNFELSVDTEWQEVDDRNPETIFTVMNGSKSAATNIIMENNTDFKEGMTLEELFELVVENMPLKNKKVTSVRNIQVNGYKAIQFEVHGEIKKIKISYLRTLVRTDKRVYQLASYTSQAEFQDYIKEFEMIADSFKELK